MKKIILYTTTVAAAIALLLNSCKPGVDLKEPIPNLPEQPYNYPSIQESMGMFIGDNTPSHNMITPAGATLGRVLFYDPRLSINNSVSCASCHKQQVAFADDAALSTGFGTKKTTRNTPGIINAATKANFFWDGRVTSLEEQSLQPVQNHIEMGLEKLDVLEQKLKATNFYPELFNKAFGTSEITHQKVSLALAQFVRAITSTRSRVDNAQLLTQEELAGMNLFSNFGCADCHSGMNFGGASMIDPYVGDATLVPNTANIGLDVNYNDGGLQDLGMNSAAMLNGFFVIPSLRNVALTAPYMHDGRFKTLEDVVEHYNSGVQAHPNLDPLLSENGAPIRMNMTAQQKKQLVAFMKTFTDEEMVHDPKFSNPFK